MEILVIIKIIIMNESVQTWLKDMTKNLNSMQ